MFNNYNINRQNLTFLCVNIIARKGGFEMKNMNRIEIKEFTNKYFPEYNNDIRKVSYIVYDDCTEYLINGWFILKKQD